MASLKQLIRDHRPDICNGVAWVAIYKDGRSWGAEAFYPEDGDHENGYVFDVYDYNRMKEIVDTDHRAICINGDYMGGLEDFTLDELENKIFVFYVGRYHQLQHDFLDCFVVPPERGKEELGSVDGLIASAEVRCGQQEYCASIYDALHKEYLVFEDNGKVEFGEAEDRLLFYDENEAENILALVNEVKDFPCVLLYENERDLGRVPVEFELE